MSASPARSRRKPRLSPAVDEVMSAESAAGDFQPIDKGAIAQLGERLVCNQEVAGSIPAGSTSLALPRPTSDETRDDASSCRAVASAGTGAGGRTPSMCWRDHAIGRVVVRRCRAHRLLFNNPESFCFDAKFSSESVSLTQA